MFNKISKFVYEHGKPDNQMLGVYVWGNPKIFAIFYDISMKGQSSLVDYESLNFFIFGKLIHRSERDY